MKKQIVKKSEINNVRTGYVYNSNAITLIALVITIILMLILAGVVISLTIGEKGLINTAKYAVQKNSEETAREKLELALADLQAYKYTDEAYNENEYINIYIENKGMQIVGNIVTVDGWRFTIDRSVPQIGESLGQEEIRVTKIVREYSGKNENGKYIAQVTIIVESDKEIKSIVFKDSDGIEITPNGEKYKIAKDITIELDKEYKIVVNTTDGKSEEKTIIEKLPELGLLISTPYVGTSSLTTKVQYATNEEEVESYTYMLNEDEITTNTNTEYILEDTLEPETIYNVKVIAKYKNGLTVESNVVTIKTEPRTYLYNNGDECIDITGGWQAIAVDDGANDTTVKKPTLSNDINLKCLKAQIYANPPGLVSGSVTINKKIDYTKYRYLKMIYTASLGNYNSGSVIEIYKNHELILPYPKGRIKRLCYEGPINTKTKYTCAIFKINDFDSFYMYLQASTNGQTVLNIYEVWLEK